MEGIEFQLRSSGPHMGHSGRSLSTYPLSLDQRLQQGDQYRHLKQQLENALAKINRDFTGGVHTLSSSCETCIAKKRKVKQAYFDYYSSFSQFQIPGYRNELESMFSNPEKYSLDDVHSFFQAKLRNHLKRDLCGLRQGERGVETAQSFVDKTMAAEKFDDGTPIKDILDSVLDSQVSSCQDPETASFISQLQDTKSPAERAPLYVKYYCNPSWNDTALQKNFKAKYARMFEAGAPHDEVVRTMRKEAGQTQDEELIGLKHRLAELQMAQSAHLKNKRKKAERKDRRDVNHEEYEPKIGHCSLEGCENDVNMDSEEVIECALCDFLASKTSSRRHFYYCSVQHAEDDFNDHDHHAHACNMADSERCFYFPQPGPPGETGAGGICPDCADNDLVSYFCSQECYTHTIDIHRDEFHYGRRIENHAEILDIYRPAPDLQLLY